MYLVNRENQPFQFIIEELSCHSEAFLDSLQLEPMEGVVPPEDRCVTQLSAYQWYINKSSKCNVTGWCSSPSVVTVNALSVTQKHPVSLGALQVSCGSVLHPNTRWSGDL